MILEEIEGSVSVTYAGKTLSVGDSADDYSKGVFVVGAGKAIFRVDPSSTFEVKGVQGESYSEAASIPAPVVEAAPVVEVVSAPMEAPVEVTEEPAKT
jgi:hypothetical protein